MKSDNWEIIEQDLLGMFTVKIWLIHRGYPPAVAHFEKGNIVLEEIKEEKEKEIEPTLEINYDIWQAIKSSMVDKKVREKSEVEAELGATKYHLEDLRKLLKLNEDFEYLLKQLLPPKKEGR